MGLQRIVKPKTQASKRFLQAREPKLIENDKVALFMKGGRTNETVTQALKDLHLLKKPLAVMYKKKNIMKPFEDATSIEFFSNKADASLFLFGSHSKKRPNNLVLGRLFDGHILDMIELGMANFKSIASFPGAKCTLATKPVLVFTGEPFEQDHEYKRLKNLLTDFFRGTKATKVGLQGMEHVLQFTAIEGKVLLRSYRVALKKSGCRTPRVELEEMGPAMDLVVRRTHIASDDLFKRALKQPRVQPKKKKNVSEDAFKTVHGRIHMQKQDLDSLQTRKLKGLKGKKRKTSENVVEEQDTSPKKSRPSQETGGDDSD